MTNQIDRLATELELMHAGDLEALLQRVATARKARRAEARTANQINNKVFLGVAVGATRAYLRYTGSNPDYFTGEEAIGFLDEWSRKEPAKLAAGWAYYRSAADRMAFIKQWEAEAAQGRSLDELMSEIATEK